MVTTGMRVWIATEFDTDDGGRCWMQAAVNIDAAKAMCQQRHDEARNRIGELPEPLEWVPSPEAAWMFGQTTHSARISRTEWIEVREVEVVP